MHACMYEYMYNVKPIRMQIEIWMEQCWRDVLQIVWDMDHNTPQNLTAFHEVLPPPPPPLLVDRQKDSQEV